MRGSVLAGVAALLILATLVVFVPRGGQESERREVPPPHSNEQGKLSMGSASESLLAQEGFKDLVALVDSIVLPAARAAALPRAGWSAPQLGVLDFSHEFALLASNCFTSWTRSNGGRANLLMVALDASGCSALADLGCPAPCVNASSLMPLVVALLGGRGDSSTYAQQAKRRGNLMLTMMARSVVMWRVVDAGIGGMLLDSDVSFYSDFYNVPGLSEHAVVSAIEWERCLPQVPIKSAKPFFANKPCMTPVPPILMQPEAARVWELTALRYYAKPYTAAKQLGELFNEVWPVLSFEEPEFRSRKLAYNVHKTTDGKSSAVFLGCDVFPSGCLFFHKACPAWYNETAVSIHTNCQYHASVLSEWVVQKQKGLRSYNAWYLD